MVKSRENFWNKNQQFNLTFDQVEKTLKSGTNIMDIIGTSVKPVVKAGTPAGTTADDAAASAAAVGDQTFFVQWQPPYSFESSPDFFSSSKNSFF